MERLTFDGNFCDIAQCREAPCPYDNNCAQKHVWERLKAYEDTGLTPEECREARDIIMLLSTEYGIGIRRIAELAEADKEGRVTVR